MRDPGPLPNRLQPPIATSSTAHNRLVNRLVDRPPGYSNEITTYLGGWGLEGLLGARRPVLSGIVNGIDLEE
jgi:hypothetical protein